MVRLEQKKKERKRMVDNKRREESRNKAQSSSMGINENKLKMFITSVHTETIKQVSVALGSFARWRWMCLWLFCYRYT